MAELISLIVTTHEREDALDAVLRSLSTQTDRDFEVIVADDGSGPATADLIESWKPRLGRPLAHAWQPHEGFRASEIRNRAIIASNGSYCIFLDGDCIARPDFVARHRVLAERGWFVTGNRILMSQATCHRLGLGLGISSGANLVGAIKLVEEMGPDAVVVTILPDSNKKYLSTALAAAEPPQDGYITPQVQLDSVASVR